LSIKDTQIQILPAKTHVQSDGSNIGGVDPARYGYIVTLGGVSHLLLWTEGTTEAGKYPAFMWYPAELRPILPNTGKVRMSFTAVINGNMNGFNVRETDLELVIAGFRYNVSAQYNQARGWQIAKANGDWVDTGFYNGPLVAGVPSVVAIDYTFDLKAHTCSVKQITDNGKVFAVPAVLQNVPGQASKWSEGAYVQLQAGSMPSAEQWQMLVGGDGDGLCLEWS
jgi:hypothetical protein